MDQDEAHQNFGSSSPRYLQEELQAKKVLLDTVHLENESLKTKINQLELLLGKKEQKISQYAEKLSEFKAALQNRDDVVTLLQQNLTSSLTQLEQQREGTGNTALHLQEEVYGLSQQLQQALQLLSERDDRGNSWRLQHFRLQQQVEKLTKENEDVCLKLLHAEKTLLSLRDERKKDENKCSEARKQLQTVTYEWSAKEKIFSEKSKKLESLIINLEQNLDAEKHAREEASRQLDEMWRERQVAESVSQKHLVDKQEEIVTLTNKCEKLQKFLANLESKNAAYNNQLTKLCSSLTSTTKELEKSQSQVTDFSLKTEAYINQIETLKTTILNLNKDIIKKDEVQSEILAGIKADDDEFIALRKQILELTNEIQENDGKYEKLIRKCKGLEEELSNCQSNISDLNKELLSRDAEKHSMCIELKKMRTENENMSSRLLLLERDMQSVHKQVAGLEVQRDELREREEQLIEDVSRLTGKAAMSEANKQELNSCIQEKDSQIVTLESEKKELNRLLNEQTQIIDTLQSEEKQLNGLKHEQAEQFVSDEKEMKELNNRCMLEQATKIASVSEEKKRMKCHGEELEIFVQTSKQRPAKTRESREGPPSGPYREEDINQSSAEEITYQLKLLRTKVANLNFVIKSLENENSNLKRHKKEIEFLNESMNETLLRNAELLAELENMTLKYKQAEIRLNALDSEVELLNTCVKELQKLSTPCVPDVGRENSAGDCSEEVSWRLSQELALNISQQRLQEHEHTVLLIKSSHEQSRTAQLTLRDELREAVFTNMALHANSLATHEMCSRLADTKTCFMDLLMRALEDQSVGFCWPKVDGASDAAGAGVGSEHSGLYRWQEEVFAALNRAHAAHKDLPSSGGTSEADAILDGQHRIERLLEEPAADGACLEACALQGIQWAYHLLLRAALVRCGVIWPLDGSLQSAVTEALQWAVLPASPQHEQDCLRYAGLCRALCAAQGAEEEEGDDDGMEEGRRSLRGQLRDLQRDVQSSVERGVTAVQDTVRGLLQVVGDPVDTELTSSPRTDRAGEDSRLVSAAAPTSLLLPGAVLTEDTEHDTLSQSSTLTHHTSPAQPDHLQNLLGDREVHQTVIVQLTEACAQLLHYYCVSEACNRGHSAVAAPSPDTSHDASNIDGFIDDTLWSSGSLQPRSLNAASDAKLSTIIALVEKYEQERPPGASCADHGDGKANLWDTGLAHGSQQDDVDERSVRNGLLTSYPHMMACLSGQWEDVDLQGLDKDVQEMTISLHASAGMLKVMHHSKQYGHVEHSEKPMNSDEVDGRGDVIPGVAVDNSVCDDGRGSIPISKRGGGGQLLLGNISEDSGDPPPDTVSITGAKSLKTENTEITALNIPTSEGKESHLNCGAKTNDNDEVCSGSVPYLDLTLSETNDGTFNSSPDKSGSNVVCQATPSGQELARDADMTRLKPSKAPHDDQHTEEEKLLKLIADMQEVKSENHRLHGLCLGLQAEKKKMQEELESLEKYSSFITRELQTVQQADGSEAPRSSDGEEYSSSGAELGAASPLAQHARSLLLQRGQNSSAARVGELEAVLEALLREQHEHRKALAAQAQDLTTQLECADRQLRSSRQFVEELTHEREAEVEQFVQSNSRLTEQLKEHASAAEHTERLCAEVEALESELVRQTRHVEALTGEAATAKEALKEAHAKIQELCAVLSNRDDAEAVSATRQGEAQAQLTVLREQLSLAHHQLHQHQELLQVTSAEGGPASPRRSPCPHCSGSTTRAAATVESRRHTTPRRHSLKEEMLQHDITPSKASPLDSALAEDINKSTICKVDQRVMRLTKNLEALQFAGQLDSIDQRSGDVDDGVSSDEEEWVGYGGSRASSLRSLSPGALDRRLEERLMAMERVTQAAVKHTTDLEMMLTLTRTNLQEVMDDKDKAQQHLDEVTQKMDVLQKQYSSDLVLLEELQTHNNDLQNQCQSQQETVQSLKQEAECRSNDRKVLCKERETLLQRLSGFEAEVSKLLKKVCALEVAGAEAARTQEAEGRLAVEADRNTKAEMISILHQLDVKTRHLESNNTQLVLKSKEFESKNQELEDKCVELQVVVQQLDDVRRELKATRESLDESKREMLERSRELDDVRREREFLQGSLSEQLVKVAGLQARLEEQKRVGGCGTSVAEMEARLLALRTALDRATNDITLKDRQLADFKYNFSEQRTLLVQREAELERLLQQLRPASPRLKHAASETATGAEDATLASTRRRLDERNLQLEAKTRHLQDMMAVEGITSDPEILRRESVASSVMLHPHWSLAKSVCSSSSSELSDASTPRPNSPRLALDSPPQVGELQRKQLQHQTEDEIQQQAQDQRQLEKQIVLLQEREEQQQRGYKKLETSYELLKKQLRTAVNQHEVSVGALEKKCAESATILSELRIQSSNLQKALQRSRESDEKLQSSNNKLQKELANSHERLEAVSEELAAVMQRISDVQQQNENNKKVIEEQSKQFVDQTSVLADANTQLQSARQQLREERNRGLLLQQERDQMQQEVFTARQQLLAEQGKAQTKAQQDNAHNGFQREQKGASQHAIAEAREVSALQERVDRRAVSLQQLEQRLGMADASVRKLEQQLQDRQAAVEQLTAQLANSDEHKQQLQESVNLLRSQLSQLELRSCSLNDPPLDACAALSECHRHTLSISPSPAAEDVTIGLGHSQLSGADSTLDVTNLTPEEASRMAARLPDRVQREGAQVLKLTEFLVLKDTAFSKAQDGSPQQQLEAATSLQQQHRVNALELCLKQQRELSLCRQDGQEMQALENRLQHERLTRLRLGGQLSAATTRNGRLELQLRDLAATFDQLRCTQEETECQLERVKYEMSEERSNFLQVSDNLRRATQHSSAQHRRHHAATKELERCLQEERLTKAALLEEVSQLTALLATSRPPASATDLMPAPLSDVIPSHADCEELQRLACQNSATSTERRLWRAAEASLVSQPGADERRQVVLANKQLTETLARLAQEKELLLLQKSRAEQRCGELEQQCEELQQQCDRLEHTLRRQMALQAVSVAQTDQPRLPPPPSTAPPNETLREAVQALTLRNADLQHDRAFYQQQCNRLQQELSQRPVAPSLDCPTTTQLLPVAATEELQQRLQHTFARYLRAQSHKKSLVWQKKYLLKALSQGSDASPRLRALLHSTMIDGPPTRLSLAPPLVRFRSVCHVMRAVWRLQHRVRHMALTSRIPSAVCRSTPHLPALDAGADLRDSLSCTSLEVCGYIAGVASHGLASPPALVSPVAADVASMTASPPLPRHNIQRPTATYLGRPAPTLPNWPRPLEGLASGAAEGDGVQHWTLQSPPTRDQPLYANKDSSSQKSKKGGCQDYMKRAEALHDTLGLMRRPGH